MRAFRRRRMVGIFALLALALQVLVAFAQTHTHAYSLQSGQSGSRLATRAITFGAPCRRAVRPCPAPAPHDDHDECTICRTLSLAGSALLSVPPALPVPPWHNAGVLPFPAIVLPDGDEAVDFQARAPPLSVNA
jgi:hypothetical protein